MIPGVRRFGRSVRALSLAAASALALGAAAVPVCAQELTIGSRTEAVPDPHYRWSSSTGTFYSHYLSSLLELDRLDQPQPGLAESYRNDGDLVWVFTLREGLRFDNGQPITPDDIIASYERARTLPNAAGSYAGLFAGVTEMVAVDARTLRIVTSRPVPTLPNALTQVFIIPASLARSATQADFATPAGNVSSGPYRFVRFAPGDRLVVERNPTFWGRRSAWERVTFRFIADPAARTAALLGGDVDLIDGVAPQDIARIRGDNRFAIHVGRSDRGVHLTPDTGRAVTPFVRGPNGEALTTNPLRDLRVRQALSLAIDRIAIRDRVMDGMSFPSGQIVPEGFGGYSSRIPVTAPDPAAARRLLAEAGYPNGFQLTIHCTNDRYVNDARICQAVGQMFTRIGVRTEVQVMPSAAFFPLVTNQAGDRASMMLSSWSAAGSGEADVLQNAIHTRGNGMGTWNLGNYSNPTVDQRIIAANTTMDRAQRHRMQAEVMEMIMADLAVIPIHMQSVVVATRGNLTFTTRANESFLADDVRPR